jgi:hypothetical protein
VAATRCNDVARIGQFRHLSRFGSFGTRVGEHVSKREPQIILKTDEHKYCAGTRPRGKLAAKSTAWDEIEGDKLEVAVKNGRHPPAGGARAAIGPVHHYFRAEE